MRPMRDIPIEWTGKHFYNVLGITRDATDDEIRKAHRKKIREYHPDLYFEADRAEKFRDISLAFSVLSNSRDRAFYDAHFFGKIHRKPHHRKISALLIRTALFVTLLLLLNNLGVIGGISTSTLNYGESSTATTLRAKMGLQGLNANQVLALMVGPKGEPGVAGVAGRDGFIGLNGYQGKDGIPGAPGPVGPAGPKGEVGAEGPIGPAGPAGAAGPAGPAGPPGAAGSIGIGGGGTNNNTSGGVAIVAVSMADYPASSPCQYGGSKLVLSNGTYTYSCNGGGGLGGGTAFISSTAVFGTTTCDSDGIRMQLDSQWRIAAADFRLISLNLSGIDGRCDGSYITAIIGVKNTSPKYGTAATYALGDTIECYMRLDLDPADSNNIASLGNSECYNKSHNPSASPSDGKGSFVLSDLSSRDVADGSGALAIQISS